MLLEPFTYSLIFELCALVSFSFAFGHKPQQSAAPLAPPVNWHQHDLGTPSVATVVAPPSVSISVSEIPPPQPQHSNVVAFPVVKHKTTCTTKGSKVQHAQQTVLRYLQQHGSTDALGTSNREIADALGLEKTLFFRACAALAVSGAVDVLVQKNRATRLVLRQSACH
jgi:hypothetical protein